MKVVVAPDKFKGSLSAAEAASAIAHGVLRADPSAEVVAVPMADGGEGTVEALVAATGGHFLEAEVTGPLGDPVIARYGMLGDGQTAVIEMAAASGLTLVPLDRRDPSRTTTRGTGELVLAAIQQGAHRIILGIGGSATNDGGAGFAQALGIHLLDAEGCEIGPGGGLLGSLDRIEGSGRLAQLQGLEIAVACDVDNPLCGPRGASAVFGPQKGADPAMVGRLDANLRHLARILRRDLGVGVEEIPGAGAAGGLGAGLIAFAGATLAPGIDRVIEAVGLNDHLQGADLVVTGEGSLDASSAAGKTVVGVARLARGRGVPVVALAGTIGAGAELAHEIGLDAMFSLCPGPISLDRAIADASSLLTETSAQVVRLFRAARRADHGGI